MTTIMKFDQRCAVCGQTSQQPVISSTSTLNYPDLDLRPAEMQRSSMFAWLAECPHCGYVAHKLENELETSPDLLKTDAYITCKGNDFKSDLSKRFFRHYLISKAEDDYGSEFLSLLHCAWTCDDNDDKLAVEIRKLALQSIDKVSAQSDDEMNNLMLMKADLLRRTGQFDKVINDFKDVFFEDKILSDIITFQIELAMNGDSDCHTVEEVVKKNTL